MRAAAALVDRCDVDEDLSPPFHHCVPPACSGRRSRRGIGGVVMVCVGGLSRYSESAAAVVERGVDPTDDDDDGGGGSGGSRVHSSAAGDRRRP